MGDPKYFLAINYGTEGWALYPSETAADAIDQAQNRGTGHPWKIMRELPVVAVDEEEE
jgi:hypothetical protein